MRRHPANKNTFMFLLNLSITGSLSASDPGKLSFCAAKRKIGFRCQRKRKLDTKNSSGYNELAKDNHILEKPSCFRRAAPSAWLQRRLSDAGQAIF